MKEVLKELFQEINLKILTVTLLSVLFLVFIAICLMICFSNYNYQQETIITPSSLKQIETNSTT